MDEITKEQFLPAHPSPLGARWWTLVLTGVLVLAFGTAAILLPARVMIFRIFDVVLGHARPLSGSMTAVAALLALVALVAIDGLLHLFHAGVMREKLGSRIRGVVGVAIAAAVIFWPGRTAYIAVELIGAWAVLIGILVLVFVTSHGKREQGRTGPILCSVASIAIGVCIMTWVFMGAVLVSAVVGAAAATRGIVLIAAGIRERKQEAKANEAPRADRMAA